MLTESGLRFDITYDGLMGAFTASHIHNAPAGSNGPIARRITGDFTGATAGGIWTPSDPSPFVPAMIGELLAGNLYVNVHSSAFPGGEIRGQLGPQTQIGISNEESPARRSLLAQNAPNPFNPTTTIRYEVPLDSHVRLLLFNAQGRQLRTLVDAVQSGQQSLILDAGELPSGVYFYRLEAGKLAQTRKLVLSK